MKIERLLPTSADEAGSMGASWQQPEAVQTESPGTTQTEPARGRLMQNGYVKLHSLDVRLHKTGTRDGLSSAVILNICIPV